MNFAVRKCRQIALPLVIRTVVGLLLFASAIFAERLPLNSYSAANGLATSIIHHVYRDSLGFMWFAGRGGLSRFDGYQFTSYRFGGLESPLVHCVLESADGRFFWISTDNGLFRVDRAAPETVAPVAGGLVANEHELNAALITKTVFWTLANDSSGRIFAGGNDGLSVISEPSAAAPEIAPVAFNLGDNERKSVYSVFAAPDGELWFVTDGGIGRVLADGRVTGYRVPRVAAEANVGVSIRRDHQGRIWASFRTGVFVIKPEAAAEAAANPAVKNPEVRVVALGRQGTAELPDAPGVLVRVAFERAADGRPEPGSRVANSAVEDFFAAADGRFVIPATNGVYFFHDHEYRRVSDDNGQPGRVRRIDQDESGNLWFGTFGGLMRYSRGGMATFNAASGLADANIYRLWEAPSGGLMISHGNWLLSRINDDGLATAHLNVPDGARITWTSYPMLQSADGAIWAVSLNKLYRFAPSAGGFSPREIVGRTPVEASAYGLKLADSQRFYRAFADRAGVVWISTRSDNGGTPDLVRFDGRTYESVSGSPGFPVNGAFASMAEDGGGTKWFGFYGAPGIVRYENGVFSAVEGTEKLGGAVLAMHFDAKGRLWIATTERGVARIDDPRAAVWKPVMIGEEQGLTSNNIRCLTDDRFGNIYAGTVRGVSRIDGETMRVSQITTVDGLAADFVQAAFRDSRGDLWFGTSNGLSRYEPQNLASSNAPRLFINALTIGGVRYGISEFGQERVAGIEVGSNLNNFQIGYLAVGAADGLRYQYRLGGAANAEWSAPTDERTITFANLAPGRYRFEVRAVDSTGAASESAAVADFTIKPPFWRTWWFVILAALIVGVVFYAVYRYRLNNLRRVNAALMEAQIAEEKLLRAREEKLAELEKVRTRIATDLHDDIGSSLTQIAVLSEVARRQTASESPGDGPLDRITNVSNELVEAMSDIVWAINPRKDSIRELVLRMRRFASDVLSARDIEFEFESEVLVDELPLGANIRREVFSIFKECVTNAVRHADARNVAIEFRLDAREMNVSVADDGRGFDADHVLGDDFTPEKGGNGLVNMRRRARELGGECRIATGAEGTKIELSIPVLSGAASQTVSDK